MMLTAGRIDDGDGACNDQAFARIHTARGGRRRGHGGGITRRSGLKAALHNPVAKTLPRPCLGSQN